MTDSAPVPTPKTGPKFNKEQRVALAEFAWDRRTSAGWSQRQIAEGWNRVHPDLAVDRSTVSRALSRATRTAKEQIKKMAIQTIFEQSAQADHILYLALREFGQDAFSEDGGPLAKNPAWLKTALDAMAHKAKVQGAYVEKIELSGPEGGPVVMDDARSELARRLAAHAAAGGANRVAEQPVDTAG